MLKQEFSAKTIRAEIVTLNSTAQFVVLACSDLKGRLRNL
jgi:hypothetical protein